MPGDEPVDEDHGRDELQQLHTDVVEPVFRQAAPMTLTGVPSPAGPAASRRLASHGAGRARRRVIVLALVADTDDAPALPAGPTRRGHVTVHPAPESASSTVSPGLR